jgi:hypothetical protein
MNHSPPLVYNWVEPGIHSISQQPVEMPVQMLKRVSIHLGESKQYSKSVEAALSLLRIKPGKINPPSDGGNGRERLIVRH